MIQQYSLHGSPFQRNKQTENNMNKSLENNLRSWDREKIICSSNQWYISVKNVLKLTVTERNLVYKILVRF